MSKIPPPPFQVGDRVVRIGESYPQYNVYRGRLYTVTAIWYCCPHYSYRISIAEFTGTNVSCRCVACDKCHGTNSWLADKFDKPVELSDHTTESLLEELQVPVLEPAHLSLSNHYHTMLQVTYCENTGHTRILVNDLLLCFCTMPRALYNTLKELPWLSFWVNSKIRRLHLRVSLTGQ
jgi:hypothetical protein